MFIPTVIPTLIRDTSSKAIIINDEVSRSAWKKKFIEKKKLEKYCSELDSLKKTSMEEIACIKNELSEIKNLIIGMTKGQK
jgi:glycerol dehydrogenase-like iron-containing ADH family enzyme